MNPRWALVVAGLGCALGTCLATESVRGQGIALTGVGPINRTIGGAAVATPLDAAGAIHWNPAAISGLPTSDITVGFELLLPTEELSSSLPANSVGPGVPPVPLAGSTRGEPGVTPIPNVGFVVCDDDSPWAMGFGILSVAGFNVNYPASTTNPILTPQPPLGLGVGRLDARAELLQIVPTIAARLTPEWSIGFAPTVTLARIASTPGLLSPPDDASGDGIATFSSNSGTRYHWGGGFQAGVYYDPAGPWRFGASFKSPQWIEDFRFHANDELGRPTNPTIDFDYPLIVVFGTSFTGIQDTIFALDVRYFDYAATDGFKQRGFEPTGEASGLGWRSIWSFHLGVQRKLNERIDARLGYSFNENPISDANSAFNIVSPLITEHIIYVGGSLWMGENWSFDLSYYHAFENSVTGPIETAAGVIPGSTVSSTVSADALTLGIRVLF